MGVSKIKLTTSCPESVDLTIILLSLLLMTEYVTSTFIGNPIYGAFDKRSLVLDLFTSRILRWGSVC